MKRVSLGVEKGQEIGNDKIILDFQPPLSREEADVVISGMNAHLGVDYSHEQNSVVQITLPEGDFTGPVGERGYIEYFEGVAQYTGRIATNAHGPILK